MASRPIERKAKERGASIAWAQRGGAKGSRCAVRKGNKFSSAFPFQSNWIINTGDRCMQYPRRLRSAARARWQLSKANRLLIRTIKWRWEPIRHIKQRASRSGMICINTAVPRGKTPLCGENGSPNPKMASRSERFDRTLSEVEIQIHEVRNWGFFLPWETTWSHRCHVEATLEPAGTWHNSCGCRWRHSNLLYYCTSDTINGWCRRNPETVGFGGGCRYNGIEVLIEVSEQITWMRGWLLC